jgi:gliding motility-associated-like protein
LKIHFYLILLWVGIQASAFGQCSVSIDTIIHPTCGLDNGAIFLTLEGDADETTIDFYNDTGVPVRLGSASAEGLAEGQYIVTGGGCNDGDNTSGLRPKLTAIESVLPEVSLESTTGETCPGDANGIILINTDGGDGDLTYTWSNGLTDRNPIGLNGGVYSVTVQDDLGCRDTLSDVIVSSPAPIQIDSLEDVEIFLGGEKQLTPVFTGGTGNLSYSWVPLDGISCDGECPQPRVSYLETTSVTVTVTDQSNCSAESSILVTVIEEIPEIFVPSGFTPNGDGNNDDFRVYGQGIEYLTMTIFDRWGAVVYQFTDQKDAWTGNYQNGKPAPTGTYVYVLEIQYLSEMGIPWPKPITGNVTLLRN